MSSKKKPGTSPDAPGSTGRHRNIAIRQCKQHGLDFLILHKLVDKNCPELVLATVPLADSNGSTGSARQWKCTSTISSDVSASSSMPKVIVIIV